MAFYLCWKRTDRVFGSYKAVVLGISLWHTPINRLWKMRFIPAAIAAFRNSPRGKTMQWITPVWLRLKAFVLRRKFDRDLDDELAFHLAMREEKHEADGEQTEEARFASRRGFGNVARIREACREM